VHDRSPRRERLFVAVNCAALAENLLESELFGHRRGAFTGAAADRKGLFETAHGGTLFLDEIGETTPAMQAKLLRVLQEGEVVPVGETRPRKVDVRLIAATNRSLEEEVRGGRFREDLYYRLRVFPIRIPPLRDRREDIPELVHHFVGRHASRLGRPRVAVSDAAIAALQTHSFPGNVRELENEIERAVLLCDPGEELGPEHLSDEVQRAAAAAPAGSARASGDGSLRDRVDAHERSEIESALARAGGNKTHAARALGLTYRGLLKKMQRLGMTE
jgi:Nif-specific regulatory protein